jgi:hypothetical protein
MKKYILLLLFSGLLIPSFAAPRNVMEWLKAFELEVKAHDRDALLRRMDPGYRRDQLDRMLEGNREQFLSEFFCGHGLGNNNLECPESVDDIAMISFIGMRKIAGIRGYQVTYHIKLASGTMVEAQWHLILKGKAVSGWVGVRG